MSMHTKEEWLIDRQDYTICAGRDDDELIIATAHPMDSNGMKWFVGDETLANLYLMRTAPQMLALIEELLGKAYKQNWNDQYPELIEKAETVLALAKAGTPTDDSEEGDL